MRKITYVCDKCGTEIKGMPLKVIIAETDVDTGTPIRDSEAGKELKEKEFCQGCIDAMKKMMGEQAEEPEQGEEPEEPEEPKEEPEETQKRLPVDKGKIQALTNAGWSAAKIADEMGISTGAVYNYRSMMRKEKEGKGE